LVALAGAWIIVTLLPYSFLTYMPRVPSRHTYLASVGRSLLVAAALIVFHRLASNWKRPWLVPFAAGAFLVHQFGMLWTVKQRQYANRAIPTEQLLRMSGSGGPIYANCFPYSPVVAEYAFRIASRSGPFLVVGPEAAKHPEAVDFCNEDADGVHY
jgi:hypothetical protein